jgi:hypothetical protein
MRCSTSSNLCFCAFNAALLLLAANGDALAEFATYNGTTDAESAWQAAAHMSYLEDFEPYTPGTQIPSLPSLGVTFDELAGGGYPFAYLFSEGPPHGPMHLGNFPNGINSINQWNDVIMRPMPDYRITAFGFWNGDGQYDTYAATAYDANGNALGSIGAYKDTFAGCISDTAISYVIFDGNTGDGWNHLDGLQTNAVAMSLPEPAASILILSGVVSTCLAAWQRYIRWKCPHIACPTQPVPALQALDNNN